MDDYTRALAAACCVSPRTMFEHLKGRRDLGAPAARLKALYEGKRIMPESWAGFEFARNGDLVCDNGQTINAGQISQLTWYLSMLDRSHRENRRLLERVAQLEDQLSVTFGAANHGHHRHR